MFAGMAGRQVGGWVGGLVTTLNALTSRVFLCVCIYRAGCVARVVPVSLLGWHGVWMVCGVRIILTPSSTLFHTPPPSLSLFIVLLHLQ